MRFDEYRKQDATALAGLIAKGELDAKSVLEVAIARAEQVNPAINAIVHKQYDQARKVVATGLLAGPFAGVPFLIKDLGYFEKGEPGDLRQPALRRLCRRPRQRLCQALQESRSGVHGPQLKSGIWLESQHRAASLRLLQESWNLAHSRGRLFGRRGGGGDRRRPADGPRYRRRGLDPHSRRAMRPVWAQALTRSHLDGAGCRRRLGRHVGRPCGKPQRAGFARMLDCTAGYEPGDPYTAPPPAGLLSKRSAGRRASSKSR